MGSNPSLVNSKVCSLNLSHSLFQTCNFSAVLVADGNTPNLLPGEGRGENIRHSGYELSHVTEKIPTS